MSTFSLHPVDLGDLEPRVLLHAYGHLLPYDLRAIQSNWRERYSDFISSTGGEKRTELWIDVKAVDAWLDARGKPLFSHLLLADKIKRNPGWKPAREKIDGTLAGLPKQILEQILVHLMAAQATEVTA